MSSAEVAKLARLICRSLHEGTSGRLPCWILLDAVLAALKIVQSRDVEDAVSHAADQGWLLAEGQPVHSLTLTAAGVEMLRPARNDFKPRLAPKT
jgi:hypothetical protein